MGHWRILADGILAGIERVCTEPGRAAQGTRHHRGGQLPFRAGTRLRLLQGKNQPAESGGNRADFSGRRRVLLGVRLSTNNTALVHASNENGDADRTCSYCPANRCTVVK